MKGSCFCVAIVHEADQLDLSILERFMPQSYFQKLRIVAAHS